MLSAAEASRHLSPHHRISKELPVSWNAAWKIELSVPSPMGDPLRQLCSWHVGALTNAVNPEALFVSQDDGPYRIDGLPGAAPAGTAGMAARPAAKVAAAPAATSALRARMTYILMSFAAFRQMPLPQATVAG